MSHTMTAHRMFAFAIGFFEHALTIVVGLFLMIVGLGLGVTMIMLPIGLVIGLIGVAMVVGGLFARLDRR